MNTHHLPTSRRIELAQAQRAKRRSGILRLKIIGAVFGGAFLVGLIGGFVTPGA